MVPKGRTPFSYSLRKFEIAVCRVAKDARNPSGIWRFTISTALGNKRRENNEYDEARR